MAFSVKKYYENEEQKEIKGARDISDKAKANVNEIYNSQIDKLKTTAERQTIAAENSYDAAYADNAVQKAINERQIKNAMADAGMQDSGLNRTQQTAVQLSKANADNTVSQNKTMFINKIRSALQESIASAEQSRASEINNINLSLMQQENDIKNKYDTSRVAKTEEIISNITSISDPTQAAAYIKTVSAQYGINPKKLVSYSSVVNMNGYKKYLENENYYVNKGGFKELQSTLSGIDTTSAAGLTVAAKQIKTFAQQNKPTKSQLKKLLNSAGISYSEYNAFLKNGQYFKNKFTVSSGSGVRGGSGRNADDDEVWNSAVNDCTAAIQNAVKNNEGVWDKSKLHIHLAPLIKSLVKQYGSQQVVEFAITNAGYVSDAIIKGAGFTPTSEQKIN